MKKYLKRHKAFTLVELLIVIAIIGVLAAISVLGYRVIRAKAQDARRKADLRLIAHALEAYALDHGDKYPISNNGWPETLTNISDTAGEKLVQGQYIDNIPQDPVTNIGYTYVSTCGNDYPCTEGDYYVLEAYLSDNSIYQLAMNRDGSLSYNNPPGSIVYDNDFEPLAQCKAPAWVDYSLGAEAITNTSIKVTWGKAKNACDHITYKVRYRIWKHVRRGEQPSPTSSSPLLSADTHEYTIQGLDATKAYQIWVAACDSLNRCTLYGLSNESQIADYSSTVKIINLADNTPPPAWLADSEFLVCTANKCDLSPNQATQSDSVYSDYYIVTKEKNVANQVTVYFKHPGVYATIGPNAVIVEYKKSSDSAWTNTFSGYLWYATNTGWAKKYLPEETYDFRIKAIYASGKAVYFPDPDHPANPLIKSGYAVPGQPEGEDFEPPVFTGQFTYSNFLYNGVPVTKPINCTKSYTSADLNWAATDNVAIDHYHVKIEGNWKVDPYCLPNDPQCDHTSGTVNIEKDTKYTALTLSIKKCLTHRVSYMIEVTAYDISGNSSVRKNGAYEATSSFVFSYP